MIEFLFAIGASFQTALSSQAGGFEADICSDYTPTISELHPISARLSEVDVVLVGEVHGRAAAPCLVKHLLGTSLASGLSTALALELPNNTSIENARAQTEPPEIIDALSQIPFWTSPPFDGRQSVAWLDLILAASSEQRWVPVRFVSPSTEADSVSQSYKRDVMTDGIYSLRSSLPAGGVVIGLVGNNWTRNTSVCESLGSLGLRVLCIDVVRQNDHCQQTEITWEFVSPASHRLIAVPADRDFVDFYARVTCDVRMKPAFSG